MKNVDFRRMEKSFMRKGVRIVGWRKPSYKKVPLRLKKFAESIEKSEKI